jgi:hypothetical protein
MKMTSSNGLVCLGILLLLQLAVCARPAPTAVPAVCRLRIEGYGNRPGVKTAQLSCTGGTITAAAVPQLRPALGADKNPMASGVRWAPRLKACKQEEEEFGCIFSVCGGAVTFVNPA